MNNNVNTKALSALAKLSFTNDELLEFEKDMENIVVFAKKITEAAPSFASPRKSEENVLRSDISKGESAVSIDLTAPDGSVTDGYFTVPRVVSE